MSGKLKRLLGDTFSTNDGSGDKSFAQAIAPNAVIGLYFSASWCGPCKKFTSNHLKPSYAAWKSQNKKVEIVFVSCDQDADAHNKYFNDDHGKWVAIPFGKPQNKALVENPDFKVKGIPTLVFLDSKGTIIDHHGKNLVETIGAKAADRLLKDVPNPPSPKPGAINLRESLSQTIEAVHRYSESAKKHAQKTKSFCYKLFRCFRRLARIIRTFLGKLCTARTHICLNILCCLPVLVFQSIYIYFLPCIMVCLGRCSTYMFCCWCRWLCPEDYTFTDDAFPPNRHSLDLEDKNLEKSIVWIRAHELAQKSDQEEADDDEVELIVQGHNEANDKKPKKPVMHLFENGIIPSDVVQGKLGDCWLMAAIACMAEFPGAIENCFCFVL